MASKFLRGISDRLAPSGNAQPPSGTAEEQSAKATRASKRHQPRGEPGQTSAKDKVSALTACFLQCLFGIALLLLIACALTLAAWTKREDASRLQWLQSTGALIANNLEDRVASLQGGLQAWGSDARVRNALLSQESDAMHAAEKELTRALSDALQVRLLRPEICAAKGTSPEWLSYAGLDLVCQAARQRNISLLEMHRLGSAEEHLAIAAPVLDGKDEKVLAILHVALSPKILPATADTVEAWGRLILQQRVAGQVVPLDLQPGAQTPSEPPDHVVPIEGTRLQVAAWAERSSWTQTGLLAPLAAAYLVLLGLTALVMWLALRVLERAVGSDIGAMVAQVEELAAGRTPIRHQFRLRQAKAGAQRLMALALGRRLVAKGETNATEQGRKSASPKHSSATGLAANKPGKRGRPEDSAAGLPPESVPESIFRAYDIRGIVDRDITENLVLALGRAIGTEVSKAGKQTVTVGRDTRNSSPGFCAALSKGLQASGCHVSDLGIVPTPLVYFATRFRGDDSGVMVTASHNPEKYNGLKVVVAGASLAEGRIKALRERLLAGDFTSGKGSYQIADLIPDYIDHVKEDVAIARPLKVIVDCGNAAAAVVAPQLYRELGCDLTELDCDPEAGFPGGRVPDPTVPDCLEALRQTVVTQRADLGLAFDADGDRLGIVDSSGKIIWPDRALMLLAADVLSRHPGGDVIFDVKSTHLLSAEILRYGGRPIMWKSGHTPLKAKLEETGALLAGERSGHIIFKDRWFGFDDALYSGARLLEVLALDPRSSAEIFAELPEAVGTPELLARLAEGQGAGIMDSVLEQATQLKGFDLNLSDGLRLESEKAWGLVRQSNTQPALVFRFEANDEDGLASIQDLFRDIMGRAAPDLKLPF